MKTTEWARVAVVGVLLGSVAACDLDLTDINRNPNNPEEVPVEAVLSSGIWDLVSNGPGRGAFGEWTTLYHTTLWAQHLAQSAYNDEDRYTPREGIPQNIWAEMYAGALTDLQRAQELGEAAGDQNLVAVTEVLMVYGFLFLSDLFGDIPYFQALNLEEFPMPEFDPQSAIYPDLLQRLATAAAQIDPSDDPDWASGDLIYEGDLEKWREFANSLRLRIAIRIADTPAGGQAAQAFSQAWNADRFDSNDDNATLAWTGTLPSQNPIYEQIVLGGRTGDFRVSATLVEILDERNDPRLPIFADPALTDGALRGLPNGFLPPELGATVNSFSRIGAALMAADAPSVLMSYAEVLFLGAEAAERGWISADPAALYRAGITASMQQYGIPQAQITTYLNQSSVAYGGIETILTQKWIALYLAGTEAYAEVRRTGIPDLPLPGSAVLDQIPARMPYPANEGLYNDNFEPFKSIDYTVPLWWM